LYEVGTKISPHRNKSGSKQQLRKLKISSTHEDFCQISRNRNKSGSTQQLRKLKISSTHEVFCQTFRQTKIKVGQNFYHKEKSGPTQLKRHYSSFINQNNNWGGLSAKMRQFFFARSLLSGTIVR